MRIITWNCNLKLATKFEHLAALEPDVAIVQESEELPEAYFPNAQYYWVGQNPKKGLGVLVFDREASVDPSFNDKLAFFLPINLQGGIRLLATWAFNYRAPGRFGADFDGSALNAFNHYHEWLRNGDVVVAGDFNNSVVWDKPRGKYNFSDIDSRLSQHGLVSAYHSHHAVNFGCEPKGTLFHTKKRDKPFYIDYIYIDKNKPLKSVSVGDYDEWIQLSDHVPVVVDVE